MTVILPRDGFLAVNGLQLHYRCWMAEEARADLPAFLLLHGLASSSYIWNLVAPLLAARGYMVVALDQRGHGESEKPAHGYDFANVLADDRAVVQALGLRRPIVVGHSWGAQAALEYAAAPQADLSALILVDGAVQQLSRRPGWSLEKALVELAPPRYAGVTRETFLGFYASSPLAQQWTPEIEATVLHIVDQHPDGTISPRLTFENHLQIIAAMWYQPTLELYAHVHCPVQIVVAEREPIDAASRQRAQLREQGLEQIRALRPAARIVHMRDTIHDIPLQRPEKLVEEMLAFIPAEVISQKKSC
ncbi:MAG TPA: alpha/beta hydrolase [Ktedonobacteraceae bacterium]